VPWSRTCSLSTVIYIGAKSSDMQRCMPATGCPTQGRLATYNNQLTIVNTLFPNLTFTWPRIVINSCNKTNQMHWFIKFIFGIKLYMFRTVPLSTISSFSLYTQQWYMSYRFADTWDKLSVNLYDICHCCVYSEKLLMMDRGTVRNIYSFVQKINLRN